MRRISDGFYFLLRLEGTVGGNLLGRKDEGLAVDGEYYISQMQRILRAHSLMLLHLTTDIILPLVFR